MDPMTDPDTTAIIARFQAILDDPQSVADYANIPGTHGGKLLDVDLIRELLPEYRSVAGAAKLTTVTHQPAGSWLKKEFKNRLMMDPPSPTSFVLLLAGGSGSGKSTVMAEPEMARLISRCKIAVDGVLGKVQPTRDRMDEIIASGRDIVYVYVWTPFSMAVARARNRAATRGRSVPLQDLAESHVGSQNTLITLHNAYTTIDQCRFYIYDNSGSHPHKMPIADLLARRYTATGEQQEAAVARLLDSL
jgi:predicted ABC-type ATPase